MTSFSAAQGLSARGNITKERLLQAVSQLLVESDDLNVSLREITHRAGTNIAAVKYHFGSKETLVLTVIEGAMREHAAQQLAGLEALSSQAGLEEIVGAWLKPTLTRASDGGEPLAAFVVKRVMSGGSSGLRELSIEAHAAARKRLLGLLASRLPFLSHDELAFRVSLASTAVASFAISGALLETSVVTVGAPGAATRAARFFVSALTGPAGVENE